MRAIHELNPDTGVENLIPDFNGKPDLLREVFESRPEVLAHNVETVPRIFKRIRPAFRYDRSLDVITQARDFGLVTKSNLILGMGETREEVSQALRDLHDAGCELITITQYLRPSVRHHPVERWVKPEEFVELKDEADQIGFSGVHVRARWSARRTAPDGCTVRPWRPARPPPPDSHLDRKQGRSTHAQGQGQGQGQGHVDPDKMSRRQQFVATYRMAKQTDTRHRPVAARLVRRRRRASASPCSGSCPPQGGLFDWAMAIVGGLLLGLLAALVIFGRRAQQAAYGQMEGQPGRRRQRAADAAPRLEDRPGDRVQQAAGRRAPRGRSAGHRPGRRGQPRTGCGRCWPASAASTSGSPPTPRSTRSSAAAARARCRCPSWSSTSRSSGRAVKPAELTDVLNRLKALDANRSNIPLPKGPVPTSMKGMRGNMRGR